MLTLVWIVFGAVGISILAIAGLLTYVEMTLGSLDVELDSEDIP